MSVFRLLAVLAANCALVPETVEARSSDVSLGSRHPFCAIAAQHRLGCSSTRLGAVFALTQADADRLLPYVIRAEARFERFFGSPPPPYLFVSGQEGNLKTAADAVASQTKLVWPSAANRSDPERLRKAIAASLAKAGLPPETVKTQAEMAVADAGLATLAQEQANDAFSVPHELAHVWLLRKYFPKAPLGSAAYYASPMPDWIDEASAQLMEAEGAEPYARARVLMAVEGDNAIRKGSLALLLVKAHPGERLKKLPPRPLWDAASLKKEGIESPGEFYGHSAALAAFLIDQSGNERILAEIARSYASGTSFIDWLARNGGRYGLGTTVSAMEARWLEWLAKLRSAGERG